MNLSTLTCLINEHPLIKEQGGFFKKFLNRADPNKQADFILLIWIFTIKMNMILNNFRNDANKFKDLTKNMKKNQVLSQIRNNRVESFKKW